MSLAALRPGLATVLYAAGGLTVAVLLLYPILMVMLSSVSQSLTDTTLTFTWYRQVYGDARIWGALWNTVVVVFGVTAIAATVGMGLAWIVVRTDLPCPRVVETAVILPFLISPLIGALSWSWLASPSNGLINLALRDMSGLKVTSGPIDIYSLGGIIWVLGLFCVPYMFLFTTAALKSVDPVLEEAARLAGTGPLVSFLRVTIRLISPAVLSGLLFTAIVAIGNFDVPGIVGIRGNVWVFSTLVYAAMHDPPNPPRAAALSSALTLVTIAMLWGQLRLMGLRQFVTISGKDRRGGRIALGRWRPLAIAFCAAYLLVAVLAPVAAIIYGSLVPPWGGSLTLNAYEMVLTEYDSTWAAVQTSALLASVGSLVTVIAGALLAYVLVRSRIRLRRVLEYVLLLPAAIPGTAFAVGMVVAWIRPPVVLYGTTAILLLAYIAHFMPLAVRTAMGSLVQISRELEECSRVCGAGWAMTMRRITTPLISPGLTSAWILLLVIMLRELPMSAILYVPGRETISVVIYGMWSEGNTEAVAAFAVLVTLLSLLGVVLVRAALGRLTRYRRVLGA
ncbi:MAG: ABC transporter permease [Nevskiales bacterium]